MDGLSQCLDAKLSVKYCWTEALIIIDIFPIKLAVNTEYHERPVAILFNWYIYFLLLLLYFMELRNDNALKLNRIYNNI